AMFDMLPHVRAVAGISYQNRADWKIIPVAGVAVDISENTRLEAILPQPRIIHRLGDWLGTAWEVTLGGELGGATWAFKNEENTRETLDYRDYRILLGVGWNNHKGQGTLQFGYVFERQLRYGLQSEYDFDPGNSWLIRLGWDY
ncbi:MAG TPA: hypothetical protein PKA06_16855, partial [Gemmatales bacterium]|nr:hypothetical protein [Gemmatales bacterium]